ncbi:MAG TPA: LysR substrate-binding domain-containing protein [Paucimonas sp.]|nr:LysR substrate-binding domain-containing protein [Paucimonas sp.]
MTLPSLRNLQVFEAAARHQNFRAAADALFLTHGAVSRQVRALEAELGVQLFARVGQRVVLTPQGKRLQTAVAKALKLMSEATAELRNETAQSGGRLTVTMLPSFATRWLLPRLPDFQARHPDIVVDVIATVSMLDLAERKIQLGIRYGRGKWEGVVAERLARETQFPVAAAGGIRGYPGLPRSAHALREYPLLNPYDEWERWFRRAGVIAHVPDTAPTFSDMGMLLQAAERGQGIALGRKWLVDDAIAAGELVRLPGPAMPSPRSYYLIRPENQPLTPQAEAFSAWLKKTMGAG